MILGSLSVGYWWGGWLADRHPARGMLGLILLGAGGTVALIPVLEGRLLGWVAGEITDLRWRALGGAALFAPPAVLLGVVSPFAARLRLRAIASAGRTVGSIAGTFAAGFWLIPWLGSRRLLLGLALALAGNALLCAPRGWWAVKGGVVALWVGAALSPGASPAPEGARLVADEDTAYQRLLVFDVPAGEGYTARVMAMGFEEYHAAMVREDPEQLPLPYTRFFRLAPALRPQMRRALMLGGGAYSYPRELLRVLPEVEVDVVELDAGVTEAARRYFGLKDDARLRILHEDGRTFLNREGGEAYDVVNVDVFWGRTIPFYLATVESARRIAARLRADGLLLMNFMSAIEGRKGELLRAEYATLKEVFPQVEVLAVFDPEDGARVQNVVLLASRSEEPLEAPAGEGRRYWEHRWRRPMARDMAPLTDDWAPVERMAARQLGAE